MPQTGQGRALFNTKSHLQSSWILGKAPLAGLLICSSEGLEGALAAQHADSRILPAQIPHHEVIAHQLAQLLVQMHYLYSNTSWCYITSFYMSCFCTLHLMVLCMNVGPS